MEPKKTKKLVLKKETISVLNDYSQSRIKGAGCWWATFYQAPQSRMEITNCQNGYLGTDCSFCKCTEGGSGYDGGYDGGGGDTGGDTGGLNSQTGCGMEETINWGECQH